MQEYLPTVGTEDRSPGRLPAPCLVSTPDSWDPAAGTIVPVNRLVQALLDPAFNRDGITITGGEPFHQPQGLWALIQELRTLGCQHILCYSAYTYERLRSMVQRQPAIARILNEINVLIDGLYVQALAESAGPWPWGALDPMHDNGHPPGRIARRRCDPAPYLPGLAQTYALHRLSREAPNPPATTAEGDRHGHDPVGPSVTGGRHSCGALVSRPALCDPQCTGRH